LPGNPSGANMQAFRPRFFFCVFLLVTFSVVSYPQTEANPSPDKKQEQAYQSQSVLRATTRLVVLDVVAVNEKGEPVTGLTADDFTVLEDGKPQKISDFSYHHPEAGA